MTNAIRCIEEKVASIEIEKIGTLYSKEDANEGT